MSACSQAVRSRCFSVTGSGRNGRYAQSYSVRHASARNPLPHSGHRPRSGRPLSG